MGSRVDSVAISESNNSALQLSRSRDYSLFFRRTLTPSRLGTYDGRIHQLIMTRRSNIFLARSLSLFPCLRPCKLIPALPHHLLARVLSAYCTVLRLYALPIHAISGHIHMPSNTIVAGQGRKGHPAWRQWLEWASESTTAAPSLACLVRYIRIRTSVLCPIVLSQR